MWKIVSIGFDGKTTVKHPNCYAKDEAEVREKVKDRRILSIKKLKTNIRSNRIIMERKVDLRDD